MKKLFYVLFICLLTAFVLCGCGDSGYKMVTGQLTAVEPDGSGYPKYRVLTPDGYEVGITLDENNCCSAGLGTSMPKNCAQVTYLNGTE